MVSLCQGARSLIWKKIPSPHPRKSLLNPNTSPRHSCTAPDTPQPFRVRANKDRTAPGGLGRPGAQRGRPSVCPSARGLRSRSAREERGRGGRSAGGREGAPPGRGGSGRAAEASESESERGAGSRLGPGRQASGEGSRGSPCSAAPRAGELVPRLACSRLRLLGRAAPVSGRGRAALAYKGGKMQRAAAQHGGPRAAGIAAAPGTT